MNWSESMCAGFLLIFLLSCIVLINKCEDRRVRNLTFETCMKYKNDMDVCMKILEVNP